MPTLIDYFLIPLILNEVHNASCEDVQVFRDRGYQNETNQGEDPIARHCVMGQEFSESYLNFCALIVVFGEEYLWVESITSTDDR